MLRLEFLFFANNHPLAVSTVLYCTFHVQVFIISMVMLIPIMVFSNGAFAAAKSDVCATHHFVPSCCLLQMLCHANLAAAIDINDCLCQCNNPCVPPHIRLFRHRLIECVSVMPCSTVVQEGLMLLST
jgi:hypothetical protein